jgi:hypothetical protein
MRIFRSLIAALVIAIGLVAGGSMAFGQDESVTTTTTTTKHHYVYYTDHEIYYAPETRVYYWRENGAWRSGVELPPVDQPYVKTGGVEIELDTARPYERHDWVIAHLRHLKDRVVGDDND